MTYAGYGAGAGLIVGLLTRHPLEDTALGGLLGYGISALQQGRNRARDVVLKPGTEMGLRIDRRTTMTLSGDALPTRFNREDEPSHYRVTAERHDNGSAGDRVEPAEIGAMIAGRNITFDLNVRPFINQDGAVLIPAAPVLRAAKVPYMFDLETQSLAPRALPIPYELQPAAELRS